LSWLSLRRRGFFPHDKRPVSCLFHFAMKKNATDINRLYDGSKSRDVLKSVNTQAKPRERGGRRRLGVAEKTRPTRVLLEFCQIGCGNFQFFDAERRLSAPR